MEYTPYYITSFFLATQTYPPCVNVPSLMDEQMGKTDAMHNKIKYNYKNEKIHRVSEPRLQLSTAVTITLQ